MIIHTCVTDTQDPQRRGRQIGERWAEEIGHTVSLYLDFFPRVGIDAQRVRALGEAALSALESWCPDMASEVAAMAAGARLPVWQLGSLNARTEILATMPPSAEGECSTAVHAPPGARIPGTIQTWDWHDSLAPHGLMLQLTTRADRVVKLFTEFGMLGKIGVNSAGLGLHFNILHHESDHDEAGVPVHAIARRVLEEATTVEEAIALARSARVSASTVLTVVSRRASSPRAASIELSPAATAVVVPREDGWLLHTNHFLDRELGKGECMPESSTTRLRFEHLQRVASQMVCEDLISRAGAMCGLDGDTAPVCFYPDMTQADTERWETLLTVGIDAEHCALEYAAGNPDALARNGFVRF
ncbi:C45 family autoproteolytic acyltransferase/hydolase [Paraburkholderia caffeinilytica]|uniref:C45 family autoproteolytic acyltransferase/hydolase n=1 Tax=Paraburkholderia caffeinilytica TaxID=1761016 RepID=UPI0038B7FD2B